MLPALLLSLACCLAAAETTQLVAGFDAPFAAVEGGWTGKATATGGRAVVAGCGGQGSAVRLLKADLHAQADRCLALSVQAGPRNTARSLVVRLGDEDGRRCTWSFALPKPGDRPVLVVAADGASLAVPNQPDPRDCGVNDLRRISTCELAGNPDDQGVLDIQVDAVLAVAPDAAALAARAALAEKHRKAQGWAAARDSLAAKFVAAFPEITTATPAAIAGKRTIRAYHIGNSLTFKALSHQYTTWSPLAYEERILAFMDGRGVRYVPGWHISWGASLTHIGNHPFEPAVANAGPLGRALADYVWDVLTLQLWGADADGDIAACRRFIAMGLAKNPELQPYLVETWVRKEKTLAPDYPTQWNREWKEGSRYGIPPIHCQAYARSVFRRLRQETAGLRHPVRLIPIGSVLAELDRRMRAGQLPGFARVEELYNDEVHLTENGNYVALETFAAVILGQSPVGRPRTALFPTVTDAFAATVQDAVWQVVTATPESGVPR